jgi:hypothetical protein
MSSVAEGQQSADVVAAAGSIPSIAEGAPAFEGQIFLRRVSVGRPAEVATIISQPRRSPRKMCLRRRDSPLRGRAAFRASRRQAQDQPRRPRGTLLGESLGGAQGLRKHSGNRHRSTLEEKGVAEIRPEGLAAKPSEHATCARRTTPSLLVRRRPRNRPKYCEMQYEWGLPTVF